MILALFETRDGMTRWMGVDERVQFGDIYKLALMPDLPPSPIAEGDDLRGKLRLPRFQYREYKLTEVRKDCDGREYFYFREVL